MSAEMPGLVESSSNLAVINTELDKVTIGISQRSAVQSRLDDITDRLNAAAFLAGAGIRQENYYPPWPPQSESELLSRCAKEYRKLFGREPKIEAVHAGLECAVIGAKYPGMDMISLGPTIEQPHSPEERLYLPSLEKVWSFLLSLLESFRPK